MAENTKISWATHTFNHVLGCCHATLPGTDEPHPGCLNCYAQAMSGKFDVQWGPATEGGTRRRTAESTWRKVDRWNRKAACICRSHHEMIGDHIEACPQRDRPRVFPSACDPFEDWTSWVDMPTGEQCTMDAVRRDFFAMINRTPNLDWLLLTKRPQNARTMWIPYLKASALGREIAFRENVWLLYSSSDQRSLEAGLPHLLECRDLVPVLGLSMEPLVGPVDLRRWIKMLNWVIVGGESGPHARPCEVSWIRDIVDQCRAAGVPCFVKQDCGRFPGQRGRIPDDLWSVKEFPRG